MEMYRKQTERQGWQNTGAVEYRCGQKWSGESEKKSTKKREKDKACLGVDNINLLFDVFRLC